MKYISYLKDLPATQRQKRPTIGAKETYYKMKYISYLEDLPATLSCDVSAHTKKRQKRKDLAATLSCDVSARILTP